MVDLLVIGSFTLHHDDVLYVELHGEGGGQGPRGGMAYIYTRIYTDLEIESVNHITYIVVYTLLVITICYSMLQCV